MLQIQTNLNLGTRLDFTASAWCLASGQNGTLVEMNGENIQKPTAGNYAVPIFTESNRSGSAGWTPDVAATGKLAVFVGAGHRFLTDQYVGTPAVNDLLYVDANGKYTTTSAGSGVVIGICVKAPHTTKYLDKNYNVIGVVSR